MPEESKKLTVAQLIKLCRYADKGKQAKDVFWDVTPC
jgi:ribosome-associated protein YbcJ (S4-like RNA binding protein)